MYGSTLGGGILACGAEFRKRERKEVHDNPRIGIGCENLHSYIKHWFGGDGNGTVLKVGFTAINTDNLASNVMS